MAGYTDAAFRSICGEQGAFLCYTEMVCAEALIRDSRKNLELLARSENERLLGVQIFASNPLSAARAAGALAGRGFSLLDLNCGCSVPKVLKAGCGAALLREPLKIREIVRAMLQEAPPPISIKLRSGWDTASLNFLETAHLAVEGGASLITLHPRTRSQGFSGKPCLEHLRVLKGQLEVPLIGSGDLFSPQDALAMLVETGCDGVMFARGALGNPFIFAQTQRLFASGQILPAPDAETKLRTALRQLELSIALKGEARACREMRKHFCAYSRGLPDSAALRQRTVQARRRSDYERLVEEYLRP